MVCAIAAGEVKSVGWQGNGLWIRIDHGERLYSTYGHMNGAGLVATGDAVTAGQPLGPLWGRIKPPHIHFEIRVHGKLVDPVPWLEAQGARVFGG
jgi:murein DD-endopeptidase MepM/ murein hydrolase activator NlpD